MAKVSPIITSFSKGELSPFLKGRPDVQHYFAGAQTIENFMVMPEGGLMKWQGTKFVDRVKDSSQAAVIIRFRFSASQVYILVFNGGKIRFYKDQGTILDTAQNITGATQANPCVITYSGADNYANGDEVYISGVVGMTQLNGKRYKVANVSTGSNTFEITDLDGNNINSTSYTAYSSGGTVAEVYEVSQPYSADDLEDIKFVQDDDVMYLFHPDYDIRKLVRSGHASWALSTITWDADHWPPFRPTNVNTSLTMTASAASGAITITASSSYFLSGMVDGYIKIGSGYAQITGYTSGTQVSATTKVNVPTGAQTDWAIGAFSSYYGYPVDGAIYDQRLALIKERYVWLSKPEEYENFQTGADDDDGMLYNPADDESNNYLWVKSATNLVLGSEGGISNLGSGNDNVALTPSNVVAKKQTNYGCNSVSPMKIGSLIYYVQQSGRKVMQYGYSLEADSFKANDLTILSRHIAHAKIKRMDYMQSPFNVLWCVLENGKLICLTREEDQQVFAWSRHITDGTYESLGIIPNTTTGYDEVWVVANRTIGGNTRRYVEYFVQPFDEDTAQEDSFFVHSGLTYDSTETSTITGLDHLEGESVAVLADGAVQNNKTVSGGAITLDSSASVVQVGLPYTAICKTMPLEFGASNGSAQAKFKKVFDVFFRLWRSLGLKVGTPDNQDTVPFRKSSMNMDEPPTLFTGDKRVHFSGGWERELEIYFKHDQPLPCNVLMVALNPMETSE